MNTQSSTSARVVSVQGPGRRRGEHSTKCKNPNPCYVVPESHEKRKRPQFIQRLVKNAQSRDVLRSDEAMLAKVKCGRKKHYYKDRVNAINALMAVFAEHVNLATHQIEISLRNASDAAGLTTVSPEELEKQKEDPNYTPNVSISRASRALADMVSDLGFVECNEEDQVFTQFEDGSGAWLDKIYYATDEFFIALGSTVETVLREQRYRLGLYQAQAIKSGRSKAEVGRMSITSLRAERKLLWRQNAFRRLKESRSVKAVKRQLEASKTREEQRSVATQRVLKQLGPDAQYIDAAHFKVLVNQEIGLLRAKTGVSPPH